MIPDSEHYDFLKMFLSDEKHHAGQPSIGLILQHLEVIVDDVILRKLAIVVSDFFKINTQFSELIIYQFHGVVECYKLLHNIRITVGAKIFSECWDSLCGGRYHLAKGMSPSPEYFFRQCGSCTAYRYLHSFCYFCGELFNAMDGILVDLSSFQGKSDKSTKRRRQGDPVYADPTLSLSERSKLAVKDGINFMHREGHRYCDD